MLGTSAQESMESMESSVHGNFPPAGVLEVVEIADILKMVEMADVLEVFETADILKMVEIADVLRCLR